MKQLLILACLGLTICSCNESIPPKQIAKDFIKAVATNDNSTAAELATDDTKNNILASKNSNAPSFSENQFSFATLNESVNGESAEVKNDIISLSLKKGDDGWKVSASPEVINSITNRQNALAQQGQKWNALLKEYESRLQLAKEYVQYKKGQGNLSPQMQKLSDVVNSLNIKTAWNQETISLYRQKQNQLADLIDKALEPSSSANSDLSMNYIIQFSDIKDRINKAEQAYESTKKSN